MIEKISYKSTNVQWYKHTKLQKSKTQFTISSNKHTNVQTGTTQALYGVSCTVYKYMYSIVTRRKYCTKHCITHTCTQASTVHRTVPSLRLTVPMYVNLLKVKTVLTLFTGGYIF